jgi:hypothetical protein
VPTNIRPIRALVLSRTLHQLVLGWVKNGDSPFRWSSRGREKPCPWARTRSKVVVELLVIPWLGLVAVQLEEVLGAFRGQKGARPYGNAGILGILGILESASY